MNQCTQCVGWRRRDRGSLFLVALLVMQKREKRKEFLVFFKRHLIRRGKPRHLLPLEKAGENACFRQRTRLIHARHSFSAGVQTMRARICSASSCDMFARVVWVRLRGALNRRFLLYPLPHALATHGSCDKLVHAARGSEGGRRESSLLTFGTFRH